MKRTFECYDCGQIVVVSKKKAKYIDGLKCTKCNGRVIPKC